MYFKNSIFVFLLAGLFLTGCGGDDSNPISPGGGSGGGFTGADVDNVEFLVNNITWENSWSTGTDNIYLQGRTVMHFDGSEMRLQNIPSSGSFGALWGYNATNVWVTGVGKSIYYFDGKSWTKQYSSGSNWLYGIFGSGPDNVYAVGDDGVIVHYDGSDWTPMNSGTTTWLSGVWVSPTGTPYVAVGDGGLLAYDGASWSTVPMPTHTRSYGIWGTSDDDFLVNTDSGLYQWKTSQWVNLKDSLGLDGVYRCVPDGNGGYYLLDNKGFAFYNGTSLVPQKAPSAPHYRDLSGTGEDHLVLVANNNTVYVRDNGTWSQIAAGNDWTQFFFVNGTSPNNMYAGGIPNSNLGLAPDAIHFDGSTWDEFYSNATGPSIGVSLVGADTAVFGFESGYVIMRSPAGYVWTQTSIDMWGIWAQSMNSIYVVGEKGDRIQHYRNGSWSAMSNPSSNILTDIWGTSDSNIFVSGWGALLHYDGTTWSQTEVAGVEFYALAGVSENSVWAIGRNGELYHWNGTSWAHESTLGMQNVKGIWAGSDTDIWVCGASGLVTHYDGTTWTDYSLRMIDYEFNDIHSFGDGTLYLATGIGACLIEYTPTM